MPGFLQMKRHSPSTLVEAAHVAGDRLTQGFEDNREEDHPGGNPGANKWFLESTPIRMPPESGGICGRLTQDLPLGYLQGGVDTEREVLKPLPVTGA